MAAIRSNARLGSVATGLLYFDEAQQDLHDLLNSDTRPLNAVPFNELCPGSQILGTINAQFS
jgi:2-oxoglutarate ferredoxin oxidoreductase subunit beta